MKWKMLNKLSIHFIYTIIYFLTKKATKISLIDGMSCYAEPGSHSKKINVELELTNYRTKCDPKRMTKLFWNLK